MITSRLIPLILLTRSSSLARPSGFSTDLSKSKNASAAKVTFSLVGAGTTAGAAAGAGAGAGGAGAGAGGVGTGTPSQPCRPVAGVHTPSRQQSSLVPFFQGRPVPLTQLSTVCADTPPTEYARAAVAKSDATLFSFFMILLSREGN